MTVESIRAAAEARKAAQQRMEGPQRGNVPWQKEFWLGDDDPTTQNVGEKIGSFLNKGGESMTLGLVGDEASAAVESVIPGVDYENRRDHYRREEEQFSDDHKIASFIAEVAPAAIPGAGVVGAGMQAASKLGRLAAITGGGAAAGGTYGFMEGEGDIPDRVEDAAWGAGMGALGAGASIPASKALTKLLQSRIARKAQNKWIKDAPGADDLKSQAASLYDDARQNGVVAKPNQTNQVVDGSIDALKKEGLITPKGTVQDKHETAKSALSLLMDYGDADMTPAQMQNVRKSLMEAAQKPGTEGHVGAKFVEQFDEVMEPLAPQIKQGNALYQRGKKVDMIDEVMDLADASAPQYSQSGHENAVRTQFRDLDRKTIKKKIPGISDDEIEAIQKVARGGKVENVLSGIGKAAPRGVVATMSSGGMPFLIGNAIGGPGLGTAAGAGTMLAGEIGRRAATKMKLRNADIAKALMAHGEKFKPPKLSATQEALIQMLTGGGSVSSMQALRPKVQGTRTGTGPR